MREELTTIAKQWKLLLDTSTSSIQRLGTQWSAATQLWQPSLFQLSIYNVQSSNGISINYFLREELTTIAKQWKLLLDTSTSSIQRLGTQWSAATQLWQPSLFQLSIFNVQSSNGIGINYFL